MIEKKAEGGVYINIKTVLTGLLILAMLFGAGGSWYNSNYRINEVEKKVVRVEAQMVSKDVNELQQELIMTKLGEIDRKLDDFIARSGVDNPNRAVGGN